jgi:hypothetical protein
MSARAVPTAPRATAHHHGVQAFFSGQGRRKPSAGVISSTSAVDVNIHAVSAGFIACSLKEKIYRAQSRHACASRERPRAGFFADAIAGSTNMSENTLPKLAPDIFVY